jgi:hypothetical protein
MALVAALAAAAALATPAASPPPGALRCNPAVHHLPCSRGMRLRMRYRFDLGTTCGIVEAWFDGRLWVASPNLTDGSDHAPPGWASPWQRGAISLTTRKRGVFRAAKLVAHFRPAPPTYVPPGCDVPLIGPPPATVATSSGATIPLARGSYCWASERSALCVDMLPPGLRTDIPRLRVRPGDTLAFQLGFLPLDANITFVGPDDEPLLYVPLPNEQAISWQVPTDLLTPNDDALAVLFFRAANGDASYLLWLHS